MNIADLMTITKIETKSKKIFTLADKTILADIIEMCSVSGQCQKSDARFAWQFGIGIATVSRSVGALVELGLINRDMNMTNTGATRLITLNENSINDFIAMNKQQPPAPKSKKSAQAVKATIKKINSDPFAGFSINIDACHDVLLGLGGQYDEAVIIKALEQYNEIHDWSMGFTRSKAQVSYAPADAIIARLCDLAFATTSELLEFLDGAYCSLVAQNRDPITLASMLKPENDLDQIDLVDIQQEVQDEPAKSHDIEVKSGDDISDIEMEFMTDTTDEKELVSIPRYEDEDQDVDYDLVMNGANKYPL